MIRATTGGVLRSYRNGLMKSFTGMNKARDTVLTQRNFNSYAEDAGAASRAFQMRRSLSRVESQWSVNQSAIGKFNTAFKAMDGIKDLLSTRTENSSWSSVLVSLNDPTGDARTQLGTVLSDLADTVVQNMNSKYGETFIFNGADGLNVPFEFNEAGQLTYRGIPVDTAVPEVLEDGGAKLRFDPATGKQVAAGAEQPTDLYLTLDGISTISAAEYKKMTAADAPQIAWDETGTAPLTVNKNGEIDPAGEYYLILDEESTVTVEAYEKAEGDMAKLDYMFREEKLFVDIGLGMKEHNGKLIESSAFNSALHGIRFLGYGLYEDGDPKNVVSLIKKIGDICSKYRDEPWNEFKGSGHWDEVNDLAKKLEVAIDKLDVEYVDLTASTQKLTNNETLLEEEAYNLQEQIADVEDVDMAEAISAFLWASYTYNAALRVGNSILSQSLMDYLN